MDEPVRSLRAGAHPVRLRILSLLTGAEMSAAEVARELDLTHANASYHLRLLERAGEIVVAGEERIRGGVAKRYRHPWAELAERKAAPEELVMEMRTMGQELVRRSGLREPGTRGQTCDAELWVSDEVWAEALALVERAARLVHENARPPRSDGTRPINLTIAAFRMQP